MNKINLVNKMWCFLALATLSVLCSRVVGAFNENCGPVNFQTDVDIDSVSGNKIIKLCIFEHFIVKDKLNKYII